jgi:hypothetical protein
MITTSDLITLPYTDDLTQAGIAYACKSLPHTYNRMGGSLGDRFRRIVSGVSVELAFRRLLVANGVPYDTLGITPFTDPDHYDVALGGRRCDLKSFLILKKDDIRRLRQDPESLLQASVLVPSDQAESDQFGDEDLYLFAYVTCLFTYQQADLESALARGLPTFLIHPMPENWARPKRWSTLSPLVLKSEAPQPVRVELGGQGPDRRFLSEQIDLSPLVRAQIQSDFYSLAYVHIPQMPAGRIGLYSPKQKGIHLIGRQSWENGWVYGLEIILAGYLSRAEYRRRAKHLRAGSRAWPYQRTRTHNLALPVTELHPLSGLFQRVRKWAQRQQRK